MEYRTVGNSDLVVSAIGLGCNNFSRPKTATATQEGSTAVIHAAIDAGITFLDGADIYGAEPGLSETFMGVALAGRRDQVVLATKFGHADYSAAGAADWGPKGARPYIRKAVEASLRRLRTDRIDLLQMHTPDPQTPIAETLAALTELVSEGVVRYIGNSNFTAAQIREADQVAVDNGFARFVSVQDEYSLLERRIEEDILPAAVDLGLGVFPYFPLFNGLLTGKYQRDGGSGRLRDIKPALLNEVDWEQLDEYRRVCAEFGMSMLQASIGWLLGRPAIASVISGATTPQQASQNAACVASDVPPTMREQMDGLFAPRH